MYRYFIFLLAMMMATTTVAARDKHRSKPREDSSASERREDRDRGRACLDQIRTAVLDKWQRCHGASHLAKGERISCCHFTTLRSLSVCERDADTAHTAALIRGRTDAVMGKKPRVFSIKMGRIRIPYIEMYPGSC